MTQSTRKTRATPTKKSASVAGKRATRPKKAGKLSEGPIAVAEPSGNLLARGAWFAKRRRST